MENKSYLDEIWEIIHRFPLENKDIYHVGHLATSIVRILHTELHRTEMLEFQVKWLKEYANRKGIHNELKKLQKFRKRCLKINNIFTPEEVTEYRALINLFADNEIEWAIEYK